MGGQPLSLEKVFRVKGTIIGNGQANLTQLESALRTALAIPYQSLMFYQDSGAISAEVLPNATSLEGVKVIKGPNFESTWGSEYSTTRTYTFMAKGTYDLPSNGALLENWTESLIIGGGLPIYACRNAVSGPNVRVLCYPQEFNYASQIGAIVGYSQYPPVPQPIFPNALIKAPAPKVISPKRLGNSYRYFEIQYQYDFESITPLVARPNVWR